MNWWNQPDKCQKPEADPLNFSNSNMMKAKAQTYPGSEYLWENPETSEGKTLKILAKTHFNAIYYGRIYTQYEHNKVIGKLCQI